jgi:hypothetical protein
MQQPAADHEAADTAAGEQRGRALLGPGKLPGGRRGQPVKEQPKDNDKARARRELERNSRREPPGLHVRQLS